MSCIDHCYITLLKPIPGGIYVLRCLIEVLCSAVHPINSSDADMDACVIAR